MTKNTLVLLAAAVLTAQTAFAAEYTVDADHSNVGFTVRHIVSKVNGEFKDYEGTFNFDPAKPEATKLIAKVKAASIATGNAKRDEHLRSGDFFDTSKFELVSFESKKVTAAGKNKYKMAGDLTMHGVTKPVTFELEYLGGAKDPWGNNRVGFTATAKINRKDYGINWNKALDNGGYVLSDDVAINLNVEAKEVTAAAKKQ